MARQTWYMQRYTWRQRVRANAYGRLPLLTESLIALGLLTLVILLNVLYLLKHGYPQFADALAATLSLLALQSQAISNIDQVGRLLLVFNILFSVLFAQSVLNSMRVLFRQRAPQIQQLGLASALRDHVILCGLGRVGVRVVTRLVAAGIPVAVIQKNWDSDRVARALDMGVPVIAGDARQAETLRQAGLGRARALIASIDGDLLNVEIALAARAECPTIRVILRAFNEDFDRGLEQVFGAHTAFSASALAAPTFAAATVSRKIDYVLPVGAELLGVTQIALTAAQRGAIAAFEQAHSVRIVRRASDSEPATIIGALTALRQLESSTEQASLALTPQRDTIIICGLGKIGYRVVRLLSQLEPRPRIVVVQTTGVEAPAFARISQLDGVTIVAGDARDGDVLRQAGLDRAVTLAALTSDDQTNVQIGIEARRLQPDLHIVLRVFNVTLAEQLAALFGIHTAFSTSDLASATLAAAAVQRGVERAFPLGDQLYALTNILVKAGDAFAGQTVQTVRERHQALVLGIGSGASPGMLPAPDTKLTPGAEVMILAPLDALRHIAI